MDQKHFDELFDYLRANQLPKKKKEIIICEYDVDIDVDNDIYPEFVNNILNNNFLERFGKEEFVEKFLWKYISDYDYRLFVHNKYILFLNHHYWGVISDIMDICTIAKKDDTRVFFDITIDHYETMFNTQEVRSCCTKTTLINIQK